MWNILLVTDCMVVNHYFTHVGCKFNAFYVYHHKASHSQLIHTVEFLSIWWWEELLTSRISVIIVRYLHVSAIAVLSTLILQWSTPLWLNLWLCLLKFEKIWYFYKVKQITSPEPCQLDSFTFLRSNPLDNVKVNMVYWCIQRLNRAAPYASSTMQIHHCSVGNEKLAFYYF